MTEESKKKRIDPREGSFISKGYFWRGKKILIVEDVATNHMIIDRILRKTKAETLWAMDGERAIETVKEQGDIDLILMDIRLPKMNGYEATRKIREFKKDLPIIAQTAYVMHDEIDKVLDAGCNDLVTKPIKGDVLLETCKKYLNFDEN